jgi:hypothetical protein
VEEEEEEDDYDYEEEEETCCLFQASKIVFADERVVTRNGARLRVDLFLWSWSVVLVVVGFSWS